MTAKKKIETLTAEQAAMLPKIAEEWIATGLSTEPANRQQQRKGYASRTARRSSSHHRS